MIPAVPAIGDDFFCKCTITRLRRDALINLSNKSDVRQRRVGDTRIFSSRESSRFRWKKKEKKRTHDRFRLAGIFERSSVVNNGKRVSVLNEVGHGRGQGPRDSKEIRERLVLLSFRVFNTNENEGRRTINQPKRKWNARMARYVLVSRVRTPRREYAVSARTNDSYAFNVERIFLGSCIYRASL